MTQRKHKQAAQDLLMHHMMNAYYALADKHATSEEYAAVNEQVRRVEKLFGYEPGSWKA